jgi:hypothetical protein
MFAFATGTALLAFTLAAVAPTTAKDQLLFECRGSFELEGRSIAMRLRYTRGDHFEDRLIIEPVDQSTGKAFVFHPEVGGRWLTAARFVEQGSFQALCTEWAVGANSVGLTVYSLNSNGEIISLFDGSCRYGFQLLDLAGDSTPEICGVDGDLGDGLKQATVYALRGDRFVKTQEIDVATPHRYSVDTTTTVPMPSKKHKR